MSCMIEKIEGAYWWYCCQCKHGPFDCSIYGACTACNNHIFCNEPVFISAAPSPTGTRLSVAERPSEDSVTSASAIRISESQADYDPSCDPRGRPGGSDHTVTPGSKPVSTFHTAIQGVNDASVFETEEIASSSPFILDYTTQNCVTIGTGDYRFVERPPQNQIWRKRSSNFLVQEEVSEGEPSLLSSEKQGSKLPGKDDFPGTCSTTHKSRDAGRERNPIFACPFFKNNPHRWKNSVSCSQPHTLSRLRQHLTRFDGPHARHECERCMRVFEDEQSLRGHEHKRICTPVEHYFPAEVVGQRFSKKIEEQPRGPRAATYDIDSVIVWQNWYSTLFGSAEHVPSYKLEKTDLSQINDPDLQDSYRHRLKLTFSRPLLKRDKVKAFDYHRKSQQELELQILKELIGKEVVEEADAARYQRSYSSTKKKASLYKRRQRSQAPYRHPSVIDTTTTNYIAEVAATVHLPEQSGYTFDTNELGGTMANTVHGQYVTDHLHPSVPPTEPSSTAIFSEYPVNGYSAFSPEIDSGSGSYYSYYDSQQPTSPHTEWPTSVLLLDDAYLPTMADASDALHQLDTESFSTSLQSPVLTEAAAVVDEYHPGKRCKVSLRPSAADLVARLPKEYYPFPPGRC